MPQEIEITVIQCECEKKGILSEIAKTEISWGLGCGDGGDQTFFYECSGCKKIFFRKRMISGSFIGDDPDKYSNFRIYEGRLTKEEIVRCAGKLFGDIYSWDEEKIIAKRQ